MTDMDKNGIQNAFMADAADVHRLPTGQREIHRRFGLWICNYGCNVSPTGDFHVTRPRSFEFYSLSHCRQGGGRLWTSERDVEQDILPGDCIVVTPGLLNRYGGVEKPYAEDTVCFVGPVAERLHRCGIIRAGVVKLGLARRLLPIMEAAADPAVDSQLRANMNLERLLFDLYQERRAAARFTRGTSIDSLVARMKEDASRWWRVEDMAAYCGLSRDQFRRVFKVHMGMTPKLYVDRLKCAKATSLLVSTTCPVAEIGEQVGYTDAYHFSRRFKAVVGVAPRQYRRRFSLP